MIFFYDSPSASIMILSGFIKKSQKTPKSEIDLATSRRREANL
jgi:phage-related protein